MKLIYQINRSAKRKTLALKIVEGSVHVHAPVRLADTEIERFVEHKRDWIIKHVDKQQQHLAHLVERNWESGEELHYLDEVLRLQIEIGGKGAAQRHGSMLRVQVPKRVQHQQEYVRRHVMLWYQQQAHAWLQAFFSGWSKPDLQPQSWALADFKSKWGHCSRKGDLKFTWKLWLAPTEVVHYVVIHELAHLQEFNHSPQFWHLVEHLYPHYRHAERWLKQHGMTVLSDRYLSY